MVVAVLLRVAGFLVICWTLREIFRDLFQPSGAGALSSFLGRALFAVSKRMRRLLPIVGPLTVVVVIVCWTGLILFGFALLYWPAFPGAFQTPSPEAGFPQNFNTVLYFSLASLTTLATGTLAPQATSFRILTALESLIGIALITASVTWLVMIYPALGRMRDIARWSSVLFRAQEHSKISALADNGSTALSDLAQRVVRMRIDFIHFPLIYYFHADTEGASLAHALQGLLQLARSGEEEKQTRDLRLSAVLLRLALEDVAEVIATRYLSQRFDGNADAVFCKAADDHLQRDKGARYR